MATFKSLIQRGSLLGATGALVLAAIAPAATAFAESALNPLTERSLLLSSSAPGYIDTDGSNNSTAAPNASNGTLAPAGSGPNGKKTGQTFTFRASSSSSSIDKISLQYCTVAAGLCQSPGTNLGDARPAEDDRETNAVAHANNRSDFQITGNFAEGSDAMSYVPGSPVSTMTGGGTFQVLVGPNEGSLTAVSGWSFAATNLEDDGFNGSHPVMGNRLSGARNFIELTRSTGTSINNGDIVRVVFRPNESVYMTNPGDHEFFVKINTYAGAGVVNGGVTVANVMTDSIHITTKVLETMSFSVGTRNPDTVAGRPGYGTCDPITENAQIRLGEAAAEYSLSTSTAYDEYSYWRLSSNSSGGATVYYSGYTLANTVGDEIRPLTTKGYSLPGTEQFGLGFVDAGLDTLAPDFSTLISTDPDYKTPTSYPFITVAGQASGAPFNTLTAQATSNDYADATGTLQTGTAAGTAQFKFLKSSLTIPEPIAKQNETVVSCSTAKMRYVANIAADTPAGVYTTKINYLAAPQY